MIFHGGSKFARTLSFIATAFITLGCLPPSNKSDVKVTMGRVTSGNEFIPQVIQTARRTSETSIGYCTATLIGPRHVLTAAHCVTKSKLMQSPTGAMVIAGIVDNVTPLPNSSYAALVDADVSAIFRQSPNDEGRSVKASKVIIARGYYERYDSSGNLRPGRLANDFDLAILELSESISLPKYARLPNGADAISAGTPISVFGFGCDDENKAESQLKQGKQQIGSSRIVKMMGSQFSLGGQRNLARQCEGDSGGPSFKDPLDQLFIVGVHSTKATSQTETPEGYDVYLGDPDVIKFLSEAIPAGSLQSGGTDSSTSPPSSSSSQPENQLRPGQGQNPNGGPINNQSETNSSFILDTALARSNGQLMMYIYSTKPVTDLAILAGDGNWYPASINCAIQPGWSIIRALPVADGWLQKSSVQVRGTFNGSTFSKTVSLSDKR